MAGTAFLFIVLKHNPPTAGPSNHPNAPHPTMASPNNVNISNPNNAGIESTSTFPKNPTPVAVPKRAAITDDIRLYVRRVRRSAKKLSQVISSGVKGVVVAFVIGGAAAAVVAVDEDAYRGNRYVLGGKLVSDFLGRDLGIAFESTAEGCTRRGRPREAVVRRAVGVPGNSNMTLGICCCLQVWVVLVDIVDMVG